MAYHLKLYLATFATFMAIDLLWLGVVARSFYRRQLGFVMTPTPNWWAAVAFYLLFILGLLVFVILPGLKDGSLKPTILRAALFGLVTYATYDLTNLATIKDWPFLLTVVDMTWGVVLSVTVSVVGLLAGRWLS
jgi:uncharacterized membrane protein